MAAAAGLTTATAPYSKNNIKTMGQQLVPRRLDPAELAFHIHDMYLYGPGGSLRAPTTTPQTTTVKTRKRHGLDDDDNNDEDDDTIHANQIEDDPTLSDDMALKLARHPALVLNADYKPLSHLPLSVWSWQETIKSVFTGKVTVVEYYPDIRIRAATIEVPLPSVIALNEYVPQHEHIPAFTKRNVCTYTRRDGIIPRNLSRHPERIGWCMTQHSRFFFFLIARSIGFPNHAFPRRIIT